MQRNQRRFYEKPPEWRVIKFAVPFIILLLLLISGRLIEDGQQFSDLAQAFLHGQLNFRSSVGGIGQDPILYHGKIYWGEGMFPALLLMPFVALFNVFHIFFYQGYIQWLLVLGVFYFVFKLAKLLRYSKEDSLTLTLGFVLGSVFIGLICSSSSWLYAQVVTTFLLLWSLCEFYGRRRWWLIGIICGLILLTRITAAPILIFFALELWRDGKPKNKNISKYLYLYLPVLIAVAINALYNFFRFGSPLNGGYAYQLLSPNSAESRALGVFSLIHLPANLYALIFKAPLPVLRDSTSWTLKFPYITNNPYGMSIFITSPYLLWLFGQKWSSFNSRIQNLLITVLVSCLMVLCFYGIGAQQFGYRYSLDFLPELFLIFMIMYRARRPTLSRGMQVLLLGCGVLNFYLLRGYLI